jgi:hypothetical protein
MKTEQAISPAFRQGQQAFIPGWTNHLEHNPFAKGTAEHNDFAAGWDRESALSSHGQEEA